MKISQKARHAILIGTLCSVSYFAIYNARNSLSAVTPQMVENGFSEAYIGAISSLYFVFYAVGQLVNGLIGDHIKVFPTSFSRRWRQTKRRRWRHTP